MARAEIRYFTGYRDGDHHLIKGEQIIEPEILEGDNAINEGYERFKTIIDSERADFLLQAAVRRDFEDNLTAEVFLRIGPMPRWSEEYLKEHGLGRYINE